MPDNDDRARDASSPDMADNHKWADRVAADRQKGLEKIGIIAIIAIAVIAGLAIVISLW